MTNDGAHDSLMHLRKEIRILSNKERPKHQVYIFMMVSRG